MVLDKSATEKVIGCLMRDPQLLTSGEFPIGVGDFGHKNYKILFSAIYNIYILGNVNISTTDVEAYINQQPSVSKIYKENNLVNILNNAYNNSDIENYSYYYFVVKKCALLTDLESSGIDVSSIYDPSLPEKEFANQISKFNAMSIKDVLTSFETKLAKLSDKYENFLEKSCIIAGEGIDDLLNGLQEQPEVGLPMIGDIMNTVTRGARLKKLYIDSGAAGTGKSRRMAANAVHLAIPQYYDTEEERWISTNLSEKVLIITTELEHNELQTIFLAFVSGVDEAKILDSNYDNKEEAKRVRYAAELLKQYPNLYIEYIASPSIDGVASKIKMHALQDDIKYVFYDYVHVGASTYENKREMRDDIWLMLFTDKLKQLANELDIHVSTATQLNGEWEEKEVKNQNLLRGSKAIADKADIGMITSRINSSSERELAAALANQLNTAVPNMITDVYKNRRGKLTNLRVWKNIDLGTCRSVDCFITDQTGNPVEFKNTIIKVQQIESMGGFPIVDLSTGEIVAENRKEYTVNEF